MPRSQLSIGAPGDRYEQEAEQMAEHVLRMPDPATDRSRGAQQRVTPQIGQFCNSSGGQIQREMRQPYAIEEGSVREKEDLVQAREQPGHIPRLSPEFESRIATLQGGGQRLAEPVRASMESRFGHDFSRIRIHTHETAAALAASINARAFTLGRDLVFGAGQYAPGSETGRRLIAHELTHSIQQGQAPHLNQSKRKASAPASDTKARPSSFSPATPSPMPSLSTAPSGSRTIRCVRWNPNVDTGRKVKPWGAGPDGKILRANTDAGTPLDIWKPDDGQTYWCHGFTFGGRTATGGPYSLWGQDVPTVLNDDGWSPQVDSCAAKPGDLLVFNGGNPVTHSGIVQSAVNASGGVDESASMLDSKRGSGSQNTSSWQRNSDYGQYRCFSKHPTFGSCRYRGINETGTSLPLPPGDYPAPTGDTRVG
ncbi:MAG TPA: DUF4157 domain-containing protein [Opitutaceae bacterium]|nr:DUF4157 domain-containing protein [Opitutaceae bacterium]